MKIDATCQTCGKTFQVVASRFKFGRGRSCSPACQHIAVARQQSQAITLTCLGCGKTYERAPSHAAGTSGKGKFCSRACRDINRVGDLHPQYLGGPTANRGPNWQAQRRAALQRDGRTCQHCGATSQSVHHIRPFRFFIDYVEANDLVNLIALCDPCHRKADAAIQAAA